MKLKHLLPLALVASFVVGCGTDGTDQAEVAEITSNLEKSATGPVAPPDPDMQNINGGVAPKPGK